MALMMQWKRMSPISHYFIATRIPSEFQKVDSFD